jgi:hypothetical protein
MAFAGDPLIPGCKPGFPPEVLQALPVFYFSLPERDSMFSYAIIFNF